jgi:hypothetical protein
MSDELKVNVTAIGDTVTVLTGNAPDPINPVPYKASGNINAVYDYLHRREPDKAKAIIIFDTKSKSIVLHTDEHHPINTTITGRLEVNPLFDKLGINSEKQYTPDELAKVLQMNQYFFPDGESVSTIQTIANLRNMKVKIETELENSNDQRGNTAQARIKKLGENTIPKSLTMRAPIYNGDEPSNISVEILIDTTDRSILLSLISPELEMLKQSVGDKHFENHRNDFTQRGYAVITA